MTKPSNKPMEYPLYKHPNSLANLAIGRAILARKRANGELPNQNPIGFSVTARIKTLLTEESDFIPSNANPKDKVYRDQIARKMVQDAASGNSVMVKEVLDRTEGKVPDKTVPPTQVNIVFVIGKGYQDRPKLIEGEK